MMAINICLIFDIAQRAQSGMHMQNNTSHRTAWFSSVLVTLLCTLLSTTAFAHKTTKNSKKLSISDTKAVIYNTPTALSLGQNRLIVRAENKRGQYYGGPEIEVSLKLTQGVTELTVPTHWVWVSVGYNGFYVANVNFESAGHWVATASDSTGQSQEMLFTVSTSSVVPGPGQPAIASDSKILGKEFDIADLTTDDNPNHEFYQQSIADAVKSGKPSVLIFATPDLCRTAVCGPILNEIKQLATRFEHVNFVHVEIYEPMKSTNNQLVPVPTVVEWQLPSEPWTFLIDSAGRVSTSYEGYITATEVAPALAALQ